MTNIIFIKGTKQSIVDFINCGLKGCNSKVRMSADMSGGQIADRLNGHGWPLAMRSYLPMPATFCNYDTTEGMMCFCEWYEYGCRNNAYNYDPELTHARWQEIYDYLKAHPECFTADENGNYEYADFDKALKELHPELIESYRKYEHNYHRAESYQRHKYGVVGWEDWGLKHYGCPESVPLDIWKLKYETKEELCLSFEAIDALDYPIAFLKFINGFEGITVYAYGFDNCTCPSWYQYNGHKDEVVWKDVPEDPKFEEYKEELKNQPDYNPKIVDAEAEYKVLEGYVQEFLQELDKVLPPQKQK